MKQARHFVCTWCEGLVELSAPMEVEGPLVAVWCAACRDMTPAFVLGGRKAACSEHGRLAMPLGGLVDDSDN